jgi:VWFA-related protein
MESLKIKAWEAPRGDKIVGVMKRLSGPFSLVSLLFALTLGHAQETTPADAGLTIRQSVQEVLLDVTVRDAKGRVVKNLKPADLEIFEDGVRQDIRSFKFVQHDAEGKGKNAAGPLTATANAATPTNPLRAVNLICIVLANLDASTKPYATNAVKDFLKSNIPPGTWIAVFNLESQLTVLHPFTTDRDEILAAANRAFVGTGADFAQVAAAIMNASPNVMSIQVSGTTATMSVTGGGLNPQAFNAANVATGPAANRQRGDLAEQRRQFGGIEGMREMEQIEAMIRQLGTLPGRKSVLLLSPGLVTMGDPDSFKTMLDRANKADVTVYSIDVNGLNASNDNAQASTTALKYAAGISSSQSGTGSNAAQTMVKMRESDTVADAVRTTDTQATLRALAEGTGGFLIGSTNDLRKSYQRLLDEVDTHYEIIYHPNSDKYDGRLRTIAVKSPRTDLNLESRTGYYALPAFNSTTQLAPYEMAGLAALNVPQPPHAFEFKAETYQFRPGAAASQNEVIFEIPAANLQATPEPALKRSRMHVSLVALVKDSAGQVVDKFSQDSPYEIPDENLTKARATAITFTHPLLLPAGHYSVDLAVLDRESNRASTGKIAFDSPEQKGVGLSSVVLVQNVEPVNGKVTLSDPLQFQPEPTQGKRVIPELGANLGANVSPYVFFVVYPDKSIADKPKIQAEFLLDGKVLAKQVADLPAPDATGAIPMVINTAAKTGNCELRITAMQGSSSSVHSLKYSIASK